MDRHRLARGAEQPTASGSTQVAAPNPSALNVLTSLMGSFWQRQPNPAPTELALRSCRSRKTDAEFGYRRTLSPECRPGSTP